MLSRFKKYNEAVLARVQEWQEKLVIKLNCNKCKIMEQVDCPTTENHGWEQVLEWGNKNRVQQDPVENRNHKTNQTWSPSGPPSTGTCPQDENKIHKDPWPPSGSTSTGTPPTESTRNVAQELLENKCCGELIQDRISRTCEECGIGINKWEAEFSVIGNDVKALYPSISSEKTGRIIREKIENTKLKFEGFCPKKGLAYIAMNRKLTDLNGIEQLC